MGVGGWATNPPTHTHTRKKIKEETTTLECKENSQILKISNHKNVNKSNNRLTPLKLYSKKHDKKVMALRERSGMWRSHRSSRKSHVPSSIRLGGRRGWEEAERRQYSVFNEFKMLLCTMIWKNKLKDLIVVQLPRSNQFDPCVYLKVNITGYNTQTMPHLLHKMWPEASFM